MAQLNDIQLFPICITNLKCDKIVEFSSEFLLKYLEMNCDLYDYIFS